MTTIRRRVDVWLKDGEAQYGVDDDYVGPDELGSGFTRLYRIFEDGEEMFIGNLTQFEDAFGGVGNAEEGLFTTVAMNRRWGVEVIDTDNIGSVIFNWSKT